MSIKFLRPFDGKPKPIPLNDLYLFEPSILLAIDDIYVSSVFTEIGKESLYKRLTKMQRTKGTPEKAISLFIEAADTFDMPDDVREKLMATAMLEEKILAGTPIEEVDCSDWYGMHQVYLLGRKAFNAGGKAKLMHAFLMDVEKASFPVNCARSLSDIPLAIQRMRSDPLLSQFLWPEVNQELNGVVGPNGLTLLRALISMEVYGRYLALTEVYAEQEFGLEESTALLDIWPREDSPKNPTAWLFQWLMRHSEMKSMSALVNHPKLANYTLGLGTLKRWSSGTNLPERQLFRVILKALFGTEEYTPFWLRLHIAKFANLLGFVHSTITSEMLKKPPEERHHFAPWPSFPHNLPDFASWGRTRYPVWREFAVSYESVLKKN